MKGSSTQGRVLENRKIGRRNSNDRRKRLRWSSVARMLSVPAASLTILAACDSRSEQLTIPDSTDATAQKAPADCAPEASTDAAPTKTADVAPEPMPEP